MQTFALERGWDMLLRDLGVSPREVLIRARLPMELLAQPERRVTADQYFAMWDVLSELAPVEHLGLTVGRSLRAEMFSPPLFAGLCSPDLHTAADRIAHYKRLIGPCRMAVERDARGLHLTLHPVGRLSFPREVAIAEVAFWAHFARMATRTEIRPMEVTLPFELDDAGPYEAFFGRPVVAGNQTVIRFAELDARRPFLTHDEGLWSFFEPELRRRLSEVEQDATMVERVRACLVELLPSGRAGMSDVARCLGVSTRTLQRRLRHEGTTYQEQLASTRVELARHYLAQSSMGSAEISFLLGYEDPNSFYRAFQQWTGDTPERVRRRYQQGGAG